VLSHLAQEELDKMMIEMDENGDGEIEFEEFAVAMVHTYDDDMISSAAMVAIGNLGTRMWQRGEIIWSINNNIIIIVASVFISILVHFDFILVPLTLAYFVVFLLNPVMVMFEMRPYKGKCTPKTNAKREEAPDGAFISLFDCFTVCKMPHIVSVLLTLFGFFFILIFLVQLVATELGVFLEDPIIQDNLKQLTIDFDVMLNDSGLTILEPPICEIKAECPLGPYNCYGLKMMDCAHDGYTMEELDGYLGIVGAFFNSFAMVMLFVIYIMTEVDVNKPLLAGDSAAVTEIEHMIAHYINLKTMLSFVTGAVVAVILLLVQVKLAVLFGIMSFILNYIPNVGSVIAMFLPAPVVLLDPGLESWQRVMAFVGPGSVQGYVGNVLEPSVFGASLNMTAMSILGALVVWSGVWGLPGAVLSVPMLGIQKILMVYTNHPFAKYMLMLIREDPTLDEEKERHESGPAIPIPLPGGGDDDAGDSKGAEEAQE